MNEGTNTNPLNDVLKKHTEEMEGIKNKKLVRIMDIVLITFLALILCALSFAP